MKDSIAKDRGACVSRGVLVAKQSKKGIASLRWQ